MRDRALVAVASFLAGLALAGGIALMVRRSPPVQVFLPTPTPTPVWRAYISGAVRNPGVYAVAPGQRLEDLVALAGGLTDDADAEAVNLALRVADEGHYHVPRKGEAQALAGAGSGLPLNVNTATVKELLLLPHIGERQAKAIYEHRKKIGSFDNIDSLVRVKGVGQKTLARIRSYIKLTGESDLAIVSGGPFLEKVGDCNFELLGNEILFEELLSSIEKAQREIVVSMFLFKTSQYPSNRANILAEALGDAAGRGVRVTVILEEGDGRDDTVTLVNRTTARMLVRRGIEVIFDDPRRTTHTKVVVIDGKTVFLGSHNFTHSALKYNNELSVRIDSAAFAGEVLSYVKNIKEGSH